MLKYIGDKGVSPGKARLIQIEFDKGLQDFSIAVSQKNLEMAMRAAFKRSANAAVTGKNSAAARAAFIGGQSRYAISKKLAFEKGDFKPRFRILGKGSGAKIQALATITGKSIGFHNFPMSGSRRKVPVGKEQKKAWRNILKVRILKSEGLRVARPGGKRGKVNKRWPAAYPQEFGGFMATANRGRIKAGGKDLVFMRKNRPKGSRKDRAPLVSMYTIKLPQMMLNSKTWPAVEAKLGERLPIEFVGRMNYYVNVKARKAA